VDLVRFAVERMVRGELMWAVLEGRVLEHLDTFGRDAFREVPEVVVDEADGPRVVVPTRHPSEGVVDEPLHAAHALVLTELEVADGVEGVAHVFEGSATLVQGVAIDPPRAGVALDVLVRAVPEAHVPGTAPRVDLFRSPKLLSGRVRDVVQRAARVVVAVADGVAGERASLRASSRSAHVRVVEGLDSSEAVVGHRHHELRLDPRVVVRDLMELARSAERIVQVVELASFG
jgi:hypothetical protein